MDSPRRHLVLVNPSAGGGRARRLLPRVEEALRDRAIDYRIVMTNGVEHGRQEAQRAVEAGEIPVVMSGDGLVGQVGGELAGTRTPMGIVPGGRGNDLARVLGIPADPRGAVAVLARGSTRDIDVGEVDGRRFLGIASCGFDSEANRIANQARFVRGNLVYAYAAVRALLAWRPARFDLVLDGRRLEHCGYSVAAANSKAYGGGMFLAPDAELDDGRLDVVCVGAVGKLRYLANLPKVFKGRHVDNEEVTVARAEVVEIDADRPFALYGDGDPLADLPVRIRVLPRALSVIVP
jgi:YegS/Rv2252/BmrU family lipid kinase